MSDNRKIRFQGEETGPFSVSKIHRMATRGQLDATAEFWSELNQRWLPLLFLLRDFEPTPRQRVQGMREAGISRAQFLTGMDNDCPVCGALADKVMTLDELPSFPPDGCTCFPWCACSVTAVLDDE